MNLHIMGFYTLFRQIHTRDYDEEDNSCSSIGCDSSLSECIALMNDTRSIDLTTLTEEATAYDEFTVRYIIIDESSRDFEVCVDDYIKDYDDDYNDICKINTDCFGNIQENKNIQKIVSNCKQSDKKKLNWTGAGKLSDIGNITPDYIKQLLIDQEYKCYKCNQEVLTVLYKPYCAYKFSVDRLDNFKPHDGGNVKISCYFCNCSGHVLYNKSEKAICSDASCGCHHLLL